MYCSSDSVIYCKKHNHMWLECIFTTSPYPDLSVSWGHGSGKEYPFHSMTACFRQWGGNMWKWTNPWPAIKGVIWSVKDQWVKASVLYVHKASTLRLYAQRHWATQGWCSLQSLVNATRMDGASCTDRFHQVWSLKASSTPQTPDKVHLVRIGDVSCIKCDTCKTLMRVCITTLTLSTAVMRTTLTNTVGDKSNYWPCEIKLRGELQALTPVFHTGSVGDL